MESIMKGSIDWNNLTKMRFKLYNGVYYQHRPNDGKLMDISVMGTKREVIVISYLYRKNDNVSQNNLDIRYYTNYEDSIYLWTKNGIQIKDYNRNPSWFISTIEKIMIVSSGLGKNNDFDNTDFNKTYGYDDVEENHPLNRFI